MSSRRSQKMSRSGDLGRGRAPSTKAMSGQSWLRALNSLRANARLVSSRARSVRSGCESKHRPRARQTLAIAEMHRLRKLDDGAIRRRGEGVEQNPRRSVMLTARRP
jgi:hypothetical protein